MNIYEVDIRHKADYNTFQTIEIQAVNPNDVAKRLPSYNVVRCVLKRRGVVPHDLTTGMCAT